MFSIIYLSADDGRADFPKWGVIPLLVTKMVAELPCMQIACVAIGIRKLQMFSSFSR